jgi:hypothetical protein
MDLQKHPSLLFTFVMAVSFLSCSKKENENEPVKGPCTGFEAPYASNDGPVQAGGELRLSLSSNEQNITYEWTGPKNFLSQEKHPVISNISFDAGGTYYARVSNGRCTSNTSPTNVTVTAPCTIADNSGIFGTEIWNFNSAVTCGTDPSGQYLIIGSGISGNLEVRFANPDPPALNKIYGVDDVLTPAFDSANVQLKITRSTGTVFSGQSGSVYVSNYEALSVVFCSVPFKSYATGSMLTGKARLNCQ